MEDRFKDKYRIQSIRLKNYDYRLPRWYFVTICTSDKNCFFGGIRDNIMGLNQVGIIAYKNWATIPDHFDHVIIDEFIVMPNHVHGLIGIKNMPKNSDSMRRDVEFNVSTNKAMSKISPEKDSLSSIIRSYKGSVTRWCNKNDHSYFQWQPRFYEHIVRNEASLNRIREYIYTNPMRWNVDNAYVSDK